MPQQTFVPAPNVAATAAPNAMPAPLPASAAVLAPPAISGIPWVNQSRPAPARRELRRELKNGVIDDLLDFQNEQSERSFKEKNSYFEAPSGPSAEELRHQAEDRQVQDQINDGYTTQEGIERREREISTVFTDNPHRDRLDIAQVLKDSREDNPAPIFESNDYTDLPEALQVVLANRSGIKDQGKILTPAALRKNLAAPGQGGASLAFGGGERLGSSVFALPVAPSGASGSSSVVRG